MSARNGMLGKTKKQVYADGANKPTIAPPQFDAMPAELTALPQWVMWRLDWRDEKWAKPPFSAQTGKAAKPNDPATWTDFATCKSKFDRSRNFDGIGFVFSPNDPYVGIDLDDAFDGAGTLKSWAAEIVATLGTYTEISPSGTGLKLILRGKLPAGCKHKHKIGNESDGEIEVYDRGRYFTMMGRRWETAPATCEDRQDQLVAMLERFSMMPPVATTKATLYRNGKISESEIIQLAMAAKNGEKFSKLWNGDISEFGDDESRADQALCNMLAFWFGRDKEKMDAAFRRSVLYRKKWERTDYRERTLRKAIDSCTEVYIGSNGSNRSKPAKIAATPSVELTAEAVDDPHRLARAAVAENWQHAEGKTLRSYRGEFVRWSGAAYQPLADDEVRAALTATIKREFDQKRPTNKDGEPLPTMKVTKNCVANAENALRSLTILPAVTESPAWIGDSSPWRAEDCLIARNGILHLPSFAAGAMNYMRSCTPALFAFNSLDYSFHADADPPENWFRFLQQLWPNDNESICTLQDWFGYCLTPNTRLQKMLMLIGPKRSGKGTIARVLRAVVGAANVCAPTLASLECNFGLQPLLNKTLAIIADARLSGRADQAKITERLLSISGEDPQTIDRKFLQQVDTKLNVRFMIISNELPRLADNSGALPSRLIVLRLSESWFGHEDTDLTEKLLIELPGILNWSIRGWRNITAQKRF